MLGVTAFSLPIVPRYAEVDQQGVVFNGHYLTWFDEACTGLLDHLGVAYPDLMSAGYDFQVVHSEIDFLAPVRWRDEVRVDRGVHADRLDELHHRVRCVLAGCRGRDGTERVAVRGHNVYVVVSTDDWTKRPVPDGLREALSRLATS